MPLWFCLLHWYSLVDLLLLFFLVDFVGFSWCLVCSGFLKSSDVYLWLIFSVIDLFDFLFTDGLRTRKDWLAGIVCLFVELCVVFWQLLEARDICWFCCWNGGISDFLQGLGLADWTEVYGNFYDISVTVLGRNWDAMGRDQLSLLCPLIGYALVPSHCSLVNRSSAGCLLFASLSP